MTDEFGSFLARNADGVRDDITYGGSQINDGFFADWKILGAETIDGINNVAWKNTDGTLLIWKTDSSWEYIGSAFVGAVNTLDGLQWETYFGQDFNGDSNIGMDILA